MNTDLTRAQLRALLLVAASSPAAPPQPYGELLDAAARTTTPVDELVRIKDLAKGHLERAADRPAREQAAVVYHAAVAAAYVHHGALISGRPMRKQRDIYQQYADAYVSQPLGAIFREAVARLTAADSR
jgi:hypothetical protein